MKTLTAKILMAFTLWAFIGFNYTYVSLFWVAEAHKYFFMYMCISYTVLVMTLLVLYMGEAQQKNQTIK